jgi:hypothetical protein
LHNKRRGKERRRERERGNEREGEKERGREGEVGGERESIFFKGLLWPSMTTGQPEMLLHHF